MKDEISPKLLKLIKQLHDKYVLMSDGTVKLVEVSIKQKIK